MQAIRNPRKRDGIRPATCANGGSGGHSNFVGKLIGRRCGTGAVLIRLPAWVLVLLGPLALAALYILARMQSRYDPLDPRFGSCIPPINMPRSNHSNSGIPPSVLPYTD